MVTRIQEWAAEQWFNSPQGGTPITKDRLNRIEEQVEGLTVDMNNLDLDPDITFPVTSVNGESGAVIIDAADVGAATAGHDHAGTYVPTTTDIKSIVKITAAAYAALGSKVADRLYVIVG